MLERTLKKDRSAVTFIRSADTPPGVHPLTPRKNGKRAVTVELPGGSVHSFRYLAAGDYWFNDESSDDQGGPDSRLST